MSTISSNTLFHFTNLINLIGILENGFYPKYSVEKYYENDKESYRAGIPMVCFCDIPLSQVEEHLRVYGQYGIGLTKKWAKKNRLNPILYLESHSMLLEQLNSVLLHNYNDLKGLIEIGGGQLGSFRQDRYSLLNIFMHTKPFDGYHERYGKREPKKFYDEREWRYVPNFSRLDGDELLLNEKMFDEETLKRKNELLEDYKLSFEPDDIEYLIISKESERFELINNIQRIKSKYTDDKRLILISKIISAEQILTDI
jgi:abortive phage resistance protein AbiGi (putative antitoxin)